MSEAVFTLQPGHTTLLVSLPHVGTSIPAELGVRPVLRALIRTMTNWKSA